MKKLIEYTPLCILSYCCIESWVNIATTNTIAQWMHYLGTGMLIITIAAFFFHPRTGKILTGITLLLTTFRIAAFTASITTASFRINAITFPKFQPLGLGLLILFAILHFRAILDFLHIRVPEIKDEKLPEEEHESTAHSRM